MKLSSRWQVPLGYLIILPFWPSQKPVDKILSFHERPYGNNSQFHITHLFIDSETVACRSAKLTGHRADCVWHDWNWSGLPCLCKGSERCRRCQRQVLLLIKGPGRAASTEVCKTNVTWTLCAYKSRDRTIKNRIPGYTAAVFVWKQKSWWLHFSD